MTIRITTQLLNEKKNLVEFVNKNLNNGMNGIFHLDQRFWQKKHIFNNKL